MMKLIFLGDSLTWGGYGGNFVEIIAGQRPDDEIINMGVGGSTVINLLDTLDEVTAQEPDGVFVMVGGNDAISHSQPETRPYYAQVKKIPEGVVTPTLFTQNYRDLLKGLQLAHIQTWVGLPPLEYNPETVAALQAYNQHAAEAARALNIPVLDLMAHFNVEAADIPDRPPLGMGEINRIGKRSSSGWADYDTSQLEGGYAFTFDGIHFTPAAAEKAAEAISAFIWD